MRLAFLLEFSGLSRWHIEPIQSPTMRITYEQRIADARLSVVLTGSVTPILIGLNRAQRLKAMLGRGQHSYERKQR